MKTMTQYWIYHSDGMVQYYEGKRYAWDTMHEAMRKAMEQTEVWGDRMEVHAVVIREDGVILANDIVWMSDEDFAERAERIADTFYQKMTKY